MAEQPTNLSDYELQRLAHIRRNHEFLVSLGLADAAVDPVEAMRTGNKKKPSKPRAPRRPKIAPPPESLRRSPRLKGEEAEFGAEIVNAFGDEDDEVRPKKRARAEEMDDEALAEMRAEAMAYLKEVREAQLVLSVPEDGKGSDWRKEAVRRWGSLAGAGKEDRDWKLFVESRLSTPPPVSPIDFLQEYYAADSWRLLVSCILMSRVSSWKTKHECISAFFEKYPTPTAFAEESDSANVLTAIKSLGLFDDRLRSLVALTDTFLRGAPLEPSKKKSPRADEFKVETDRKSVHKVHGVGPFGVESWLVFCKDQGATIKLSKGGEPLAPFVAWRKRAAKADAKK